MNVKTSMSVRLAFTRAKVNKSAKTPKGLSLALQIALSKDGFKMTKRGKYTQYDF